MPLYNALPVIDNPGYLSSGQTAPGRHLFHDTVSPATGQLWLCSFVADKTETVSTLTVSTRTTAAAATPTLCRMGVYSVDSSDNMTLVGSTANDTTLFAATNTAYPKALSASFVKTVGQRYATALLVVSGAATPNFVGWSPAPVALVSTVLKLNPALYTLVSAQADLPGSIAVGSLAGLQGAVGVQLS